MASKWRHPEGFGVLYFTKGGENVVPLKQLAGLFCYKRLRSKAVSKLPTPIIIIAHGSLLQLPTLSCPKSIVSISDCTVEGVNFRPQKRQYFSLLSILSRLLLGGILNNYACMLWDL